jgi:hypothetical protein
LFSIQGNCTPPYPQYNYKRYSEIIPMHNSKCYENQKCSYPCPHELGYGKLVYPHSHFCFEVRFKINKYSRITKHQLFAANCEYKNYESIHEKISPEVGKQLKLASPVAPSMTEKRTQLLYSNHMLNQCNKNSYCVHCRFRSDRCICPLVSKESKFDIKRGLDGPMNIFYRTFYCKECHLIVKQCDCIQDKKTRSTNKTVLSLSTDVSKNKKKRIYALSLTKPLPAKYIVYNECNCRNNWLNCECTYMSHQEYQEYNFVNNNCRIC